LAALAAMGQAPALAEGETAPKALTNEELPTAAAEVATELEKIAAEARFAADPREPAARTAAVLAAYFRTPD
jgi:hypothetical protein